MPRVGVGGGLTLPSVGRIADLPRKKGKPSIKERLAVWNWGTIGRVNLLEDGKLADMTANNVWSSAYSFTVLEGSVYWEVLIEDSSGGTSQIFCGVTTPTVHQLSGLYTHPHGFGYYGLTGGAWSGNTGKAYGNPYGNNDVIGVAFDAPTRKLFFSKNGTWIGNPTAKTGEAYTVPSNIGTLHPAVDLYDNHRSARICSRFSELSFTPPEGYDTLSTISGLLPNHLSSVTNTEGGKLLTFVGSWTSARLNRALPSQSVYWEYEIVTFAPATGLFLGISDRNENLASHMGSGSTNYAGYHWSTSYPSGRLWATGGSLSAYGSTFGQGDTIGVLYDGSTRQISFSKNGTWMGIARTMEPNTYFPTISGLSGSSVRCRSNRGELRHSIPSGAIPLAEVA